MDAGKRIARLVQEACIREACAPKPGNVNRNHDFSDTSLEDFLISAVAIGPSFENASQMGVGQIVRQAIVDTRRRVQSNTNLGIILLLAPLAKAWLATPGSLRQSVGSILRSLSVEDARYTYDAIRLSKPAGLGRVSMADIAEDPSVTLLEAMSMAKDRDAVASEYVTDFEITFGTGLPALKESLSQGVDFSDAVVQTFLTILSRVPDTLIARKNGMDLSCRISQRAQEVLLQGSIYTTEGRAKIQELDRSLRDDSHKLNPGTTADLTSAAVFLALLESESETQ